MIDRSARKDKEEGNNTIRKEKEEGKKYIKVAMAATAATTSAGQNRPKTHGGAHMRSK